MLLPNHQYYSELARSTRVYRYPHSTNTLSNIIHAHRSFVFVNATYHLERMSFPFRVCVCWNGGEALIPRLVLTIRKDAVILYDPSTIHEFLRVIEELDCNFLFDVGYANGGNTKISRSLLRYSSVLVPQKT